MFQSTSNTVSALIRVTELTGGTLSTVVPLHTSSLLFLIGGGRSPLYAPNKVILWDDAVGAEVAELEFRERVRGLACRRGWLAVALRRRVVLFEVGHQVSRSAEWDTSDNPRGTYLINRLVRIMADTPFRLSGNGYGSAFHSSGHSRPTDGPCTTHPSPPLHPSNFPWSSTSRNAQETTTSALQTSNLHNSRSHDCVDDSISSAIWPPAGHHVLPGNTD
jgi:WD repeat-containing protein 45